VHPAQRANSKKRRSRAHALRVPWGRWPPGKVHPRVSLAAQGNSRMHQVKSCASSVSPENTLTPMEAALALPAPLVQLWQQKAPLRAQNAPLGSSRVALASRPASSVQEGNSRPRVLARRAQNAPEDILHLKGFRLVQGRRTKTISSIMGWRRSARSTAIAAALL